VGEMAEIACWFLFLVIYFLERYTRRADSATSDGVDVSFFIHDSVTRALQTQVNLKFG
jgi:hypothetical protein